MGRHDGSLGLNVSICSFVVSPFILYGVQYTSLCGYFWFSSLKVAFPIPPFFLQRDWKMAFKFRLEFRHNAFRNLWILVSKATRKEGKDLAHTVTERRFLQELLHFSEKQLLFIVSMVGHLLSPFCLSGYGDFAVSDLLMWSTDLLTTMKYTEIALYCHMNAIVMNCGLSSRLCVVVWHANRWTNCAAA